MACHRKPAASEPRGTGQPVFRGPAATKDIAILFTELVKLLLYFELCGLII